jgi:hypothetical protein
MNGTYHDLQKMIFFGGLSTIDHDLSSSDCQMKPFFTIPLGDA